MGEFNVIIVGGGLAGPLLASGLLQSGVKVDVYEKLAGDAKRDGYQIRVAQPCLRAFRENLSADQCQRINAKLGHFDTNKETTPIWYDHKLNTLLHMGRINEQYHGSAPIDRVILRNIIIEQPVEKGIMHFGKSFSGYEIISDQGRERVRVSFEDGSSADCLNNIQPVPVINFICKARLSKEKLAALPAPARPYIPKRTETDPEIGKGEAAAISSNDDEEEAATFTFSFLHLKDDCPKDIKELDNASKWKFLEESVSDWDDAL
ncbi:hypothetical protein EIK77_002305 [Talaromyces pinophilus]|nr:hypothetical protein EIK77_002305 [Talaromyces pinophilus]